MRKIHCYPAQCGSKSIQVTETRCGECNGTSHQSPELDDFLLAMVRWDWVRTATHVLSAPITAYRFVFRPFHAALMILPSIANAHLVTSVGRQEQSKWYRATARTSPHVTRLKNEPNGRVGWQILTYTTTIGHSSPHHLCGNCCPRYSP